MSQTVTIFISGITGVFVGMAFLYGVIKLNTFVTEMILKKGRG